MSGGEGEAGEKSGQRQQRAGRAARADPSPRAGGVARSTALLDGVALPVPVYVRGALPFVAFVAFWV